MQTQEQPSTILDFYSRSHTAWLHACGEKATALLVEKASANPGKKILEIGIGTGATMVVMAQKLPDAELYGVDISREMLQKAETRLWFCGLHRRCQLSLLSPGSPLPYPDTFFDTVYAESVLGILECAHFVQMIEEINRVLKPGGRLLFNETIWLESTLAATIKRINQECQSAFGIIQANEDYPYPADWSGLLKEKGFEMAEIFRLDQIQLPMNTFSGGFRSRLFTFFGKIKSTMFYPRFFKKMEKTGKKINGEEQLMAGFMVVAKKTKPFSVSPVLHQ